MVGINEHNVLYKLQQGMVSLLLLAPLLGCVSSPAPQTTRDDAFFPENWSMVAVLPFSGHPAFSRPSAEFFAYKLQKQQRYGIMTPGVVELTLLGNSRANVSEPITIEQAKSLGQLLGVQSVVLGDIKLEGWFAIATVKLIDVPSGRVVASIVRPNALGFTGDQYALVSNAIELAAADMIKTMDAFGKTH